MGKFFVGYGFCRVVVLMIVGVDLSVLFVLVVGYLFGSIFFGLFLICFVGKGDIRAIGFGNIGVINVLCIGSKLFVVVILLLMFLRVLLWF